MALNTVLCLLLALTCVPSVWSDAANAWPVAEEGYDDDNSVDIGPQEDIPFLSDLAFQGFPGSNHSQETKIVGGEEVWKYKLNFLVLINYKNVKPSELQVVAGEYDLRVTEGDEQIRSVKEIIQHPEYHEFAFYNDLSVLKLSKPLSYNVAVQPMKLNTDDQCPQYREVCSTAGWGKTSYPGLSSPVPLQINIPAASDSTCEEKYFNFGPDQLCVGGEGKESCKGDSGGPLLCYCKGWKLAGITSHGKPCGHVGYPTCYAKVSKFHNWIAMHMSG